MTSTDGLVAALARAQLAFPAIPKAHINPHFKSKYADLSDVLAAVRPCLNAEGIWLTQPVGTDMDGRVRLFTRLEGHGEVREASLPLYLDNLTPQQLLSTLTYYRRGMLAALLGVAAEDDDDGNAANEAPKAKPEQMPTVMVPADWQTRPLAQMTFQELRAVAFELGHAFSGGSKSELIRQLEPLVRAASGEEPWPVEGEGGQGGAPQGSSIAPSHPEPDAIPFEPTVFVGAATESGTARRARNSAAVAVSSDREPPRDEAN